MSGPLPSLRTTSPRLRLRLRLGLTLAGALFAVAQPAAGRDDGSNGEPDRLLVAQATPTQEGQTLQIGTPPPAPGSSDSSLQIGTPPPPPGGSGTSLQIGTPPPAPGSSGSSLQIGTPPPAPGSGLTIGSPPPPAPSALDSTTSAESESLVEFSFPWLRAEGGYLPAESRADGVGFLSGALQAEIRPPELENWSIVATVRADGYEQSGRFDESSGGLDYGETYLRYEGEHTRITIGAQDVVWGRVDEVPVTDQLGVQDASRYILDEQSDRRRAVPALRLEHTLGEYKFDGVLIPWFRPAELADQESLWFTARPEDGRLIGIKAGPVYSAAIRTGTFGEADDFEDFGGAGLRLSRRGTTVDAAVSVQRVRRSLPYYQLDPAVRAAFLAGAPLPVAIASGSGPTFREVHPLTWVVGGDAEFEALGGTIRVEAAWFSDVPVTTADARLETHGALDWVGGYEFFPGDGNARVTLQLAGHHMLGAPSGILDRDRIYSFLGEFEVPFAQERWVFETRAAIGLNDRDIYLNPKLSFVGWEPHRIYIGAHLFSGSEATLNGFYEDNDQIVLGWRAQF